MYNITSVVRSHLKSSITNYITTWAARGNLITRCYTLQCLCASLCYSSVISLQELNLRAQGEVIIRDALRELDMWGAGAVFQLTDYEDSHKAKVQLIKEWKELVTQVSIVLLQFSL